MVNNRYGNAGKKFRVWKVKIVELTVSVVMSSYAYVYVLVERHQSLSVYYVHIIRAGSWCAVRSSSCRVLGNLRTTVCLTYPSCRSRSIPLCTLAFVTQRSQTINRSGPIWNFNAPVSSFCLSFLALPGVVQSKVSQSRSKWSIYYFIYLMFGCRIWSGLF